MNATVMILAEARDEYGNRRNIGLLRFTVDDLDANPTQYVWFGDRYLRGITRYESVPRTLRVTASDGDVAVDLNVEFSTGS